VVEHHLLRELLSIFCPETVASFKDEDLKRIAAKLPENIKKRKSLQELYKNLRDSL